MRQPILVSDDEFAASGESVCRCLQHVIFCGRQQWFSLLYYFAAMAEMGGYNVDTYLENNFQMPEEVMALARKNANDDKRQTSNANKQTLPEVVFALCEEA